MDVRIVPSVSPNDPLPSGVDVINTLPDEVLLKIFGYLDSEDIVWNISKVSQRFETLSKDSTLLRKIVFKQKDLVDKSMVDALKRSKNLIEFHFDITGIPCESYLHNLLVIAMNQCPKLKVIDIIGGCLGGRIYDRTLLYIIEHGKNIETLTVDGLDIIKQISIYPETFGKLKNLCKLCFFPVNENDDHHDIFKALTNSCENLEELTLYPHTEVKECVLKLLDKSKCTLKYFKLYYNHFNPAFISETDIQKFHDMLGKCKNMESLNINGDFLDLPEDIATFISAIATLKNLTCLEIRGGVVDNESPSIVEIFNSGYLKNLKEFRFGCCDQTGESAKYGVIEIIKAINKGCPNLEVLNLLNFIPIEFDNGRVVYCSICRTYHLKDQP